MAITEKYASRLGSGANDGSSAANAWTLAQAVTAVNALGAGGAAGMRINYKKDGTVDANTTVARTFSVGGTVTSPFIFRGYLTSIGDYDLGRSTGGTGALVATNIPEISFTTAGLTFTTYSVVEGISVTSGINGSALVLVALSAARSVIATNSRTGGGTGMQSGTGLVTNCDISHTGTIGTALNASNTNIVGNRITAGTSGATTGILVGSTTNSSITIGNVIYRCVTGISGVGTGHTHDIHGNTIAICTTGFLGSSASTTMQRFTNNLFADISGNAIDHQAGAQGPVALSHNRFDRCGGISNGAVDWIAATNWLANITSVTQSQEFVDAATNDFRLQSTSPAVGAGLFPSRDIGALQRPATAAGGIIKVGMRGGFL